MTDSLTIFRTPHEQAFRELGVVPGGQQWSAFDVPRKQALAGKAKLFVTTIWNIASVVDSAGRRTATNEPMIKKDRTDGTFWYPVRVPLPNDPKKKRVAHWRGVELAIKHGIQIIGVLIQIIGVLKDVRSSKCSLEHIFDCVNPRRRTDGCVMWLQVKPRGDVGCDVGTIDIRQTTVTGVNPSPLVQMHEDFELAVQEASKLSAIRRKERLASAPRIPKQLEVTTTIFDRNPDVVAEVRKRARGVCDECKKAAPFLRRSDGSPYLEVHHRISLANGGEDTVENAVALCPNCHRAAHHG